MKRIFLFLFVGLILILCTVRAEARSRTRAVTAPAIYWQYYNAYYAPMAMRAYYSIPPALRPVRVYQQRGVVPQPVYIPSSSGNASPQTGTTVSPKQKPLSWKQQSVLRRQKLVAQRKKAAEEQKKLRAERKKLNEQKRAQSNASVPHAKDHSARKH